MKFTRSLPANARASAKTPERMVMRRMLTLNRWMKKSSSEHTAQQTNRAMSRWSSTMRMKSLPASSDLSPLNTAK